MYSTDLVPRQVTVCTFNSLAGTASRRDTFKNELIPNNTVWFLILISILNFICFDLCTISTLQLFYYSVCSCQDSLYLSRNYLEQE